VTERRVGQGWDVHAFEAGRPLVLGGVRIEHDRGLAGHSDADALLHAVTDAVLGASGRGDIGEHFPDTDPRWKGASSRDLLRHVMDLVSGDGWRVVNADCTVVAQEPRLSPVKASIRDSLAGLLRVTADRVNVKAKTAERLGPVGRGEGIEAQAVVLLERPGA
jgi:2-C-methyl-D-erythritol 2,4-cyclodiphosphate synthase